MLDIHSYLELVDVIINDSFSTRGTLARVTGATCVPHKHLLVQTVTP
jgi:hypothetical protein